MSGDLFSVIKDLFIRREDDDFLINEEFDHSLPLDVEAEILADIIIEIDDAPKPILGELSDETVMAEIIKDSEIDAPVRFNEEILMAEIHHEVINSSDIPSRYNEQAIIAEIQHDVSVELDDFPSAILGMSADEVIEKDILREIEFTDYTPVFEANQLDFDPQP